MTSNSYKQSNQSDPFDWEMRLFLSADLTGSTKFKNTCRNNENENMWEKTICDFYSDFAQYLEDFSETNRAKEINQYDIKLWKLLGDEILFSVKLKDYRAVLLHMSSFVSTLKEVNSGFELIKQPLKCKGTAWLAGFPVNNRIIRKRIMGESILDYIGSSIDCGFRLSKFSTDSKLVISVDLALILATAIGDNEIKPDRIEELDTLNISYDGKYTLKGINQDKGYPVFWVIVNDNKTKEDKLIKECGNTDIIKFCEEFFKETSGFNYPFIDGDENRFNKIDSEVEERRDKIRNDYMNTIGGDEENEPFASSSSSSSSEEEIMKTIESKLPKNLNTSKKDDKNK